ncbi:MAG TPA: hypothetical protein VHD88_00315, partial [Pyrinomonadaceae bacterium]|nr:hypothetical protein [Pyrinomonadaceae bacterium]
KASKARRESESVQRRDEAASAVQSVLTGRGRTKKGIETIRDGAVVSQTLKIESACLNRYRIGFCRRRNRY